MPKKISPRYAKDGNIFRSSKHDVYFWNEEWQEYTFYREDEYGFRIEPVGRGPTLEKARKNYEAGLKRLSGERAYA